LVHRHIALGGEAAAGDPATERRKGPKGTVMQTVERTANDHRPSWPTFSLIWGPLKRAPLRWACLIAAAILALIMTAGHAPAQGPKKASAADKARPAEFPVTVGFDSGGLPINVAEMREAILAAAHSGDVTELLIPIQWNELPPDFGEKPVKETLLDWQKQSHDGSGREMLALLANILAGPYAVRRQGPDVENAKIYIWPAFAELPLDKLTPPLEVALLRLLSVAEVKRMKKAGRYDGYGLAIGADGTWHAFKQVRHGEPKPKP
jgi:hypothetical protein